MGKVIAPLAEGSVPAHTIFDRRFVVECCERFHLHWRNIRLELTHENWVAFAETMEKAIGTWRANGSPKEHFHLELGKHMMDTQEIVHPTTVGVELCENLYKTMRATHGADADFWEEDAFVHFHYRDMRFEMSIEDFLGFSGTMSAARERLQTILYRPIEQLFETLNEHNILYVVSRNWEALPGSVEVGPHSDLDLLVHPAHVAKLDELWNTTRTQPEPYRVQRKVPVLGPNGEQTFILTDVRTTDDGYMPEEWSHLLLARRVPQHMFYVLPPKDYFLSLLYHVVVHKGVMSDDYARRLAVLAHAAGIEFPIDRVNDLGHHLTLLREHGVVPVEPVDVSVLPKMPFIEAPETAISSRILDIHEGRPYHSRVHMLDGLVRKQTTFDLAAREHALLGRLSGPHFPRALATSSGPVWTSCDLELVDGFPLTDEARIAVLSAKGARSLVSECLTILDELAAAGITHRDIKADNILVRDGAPVLLDFGWSTAPDLPHVTPGGLGNDGKPADGFCDTFAIGRALAGVCGSHPEVLPTLEAMTRPSRSDRNTDTTELRALLAKKSTKAEVDAAREALAARLAPPAPPVSYVPEPVAVETDVTPVQVLAFAAELIADPSLLAAYGEAFKPGDPVQLIAYAPDCDPGDIAPALESALEGFTVDAVLLAVAGGKETERTIAASARVLLGSAPSAGPLTELERADGSDAKQLRELAFPAEGGEAPLVSIVIPVFNRVDLTKQCIETIVAVTDTPTYEIIVVDNGSTDGTADFLRSEQVAGRIRCVINEENLGFGGACNQGAELARGKYVLLLNNDTLPEAGWLKPLVDTMRDTGVGIVGSRLLYPDRTIQHAGIVWSEQGTPTHVNRGVPADSPSVLEQADFSAVTGACLLIPRDLFFEVGAFDTEYHMYVEDIDLCLRVWESGHRVVYCPESVVVHLENASMTDVEWRDRNVVAGWKRLAERWSGRWPAPVRRMAWPTVLSGGPAHPAAIAFADDVLAHPELVGRWSEAFAPGDAMLVIFGPGHDAQTLAGRLRNVLSAYDLEGAGLDVLVLAAPAGAGPDAKLMGALSAVLSSAPVMGSLAGLPRYDESSVAEFAAQVTGSAIAA